MWKLVGAASVAPLGIAQTIMHFLPPWVERAAFSLLAQMKSVNVRPNSFTYNALIDACAKAAEVDRGFEVLRQMAHEGIQPNTTTYTQDGGTNGHVFAIR